jgi:MFS family permease
MESSAEARATTRAAAPQPVSTSNSRAVPVSSARSLAMPGSRWSPRLWAILLVLCGAICLDALDVSMVGVALPDIRTALGLSTSSLQWVVSGYVLGYGGLLLLGGRAADLLGRRRVFLAALAVFAVASLFGGLVSSPGLLIAARFIKGIAAAFTAPAGLSLLTTTFHEGPMRNRAISVYSAFGASGFSLGLVLSGLLTEVSWRWTLLIPAPVALLVLAAAIPVIPRDTRERDGAPARGSRAPRRRFDVPGAVTISGAMLLLVYTVVEAQQAGWASARTIGSFAVVAAALAAFVTIERRSADPLVRLSLFRSGGLARANIGALTLFGSYVSFQFLVTQYLQSLAGWSALRTALAFLPAGLVVAGLSTRMDGIIGRFGPARVSVAAFASLVAGYVVFLRVGTQPDYLTVIFPAVVLIGIAFGLGFSALSLAATAGVADAEQGLAASLFQTSFQVGGAVVLAVVTAVVDAGGASRITSAQATLGAYRPALAVITGVSVLGVLTALSGLRRDRQRVPARTEVFIPAAERNPIPGTGELTVTRPTPPAALDAAARDAATRDAAARDGGTGDCWDEGGDCWELVDA